MLTIGFVFPFILYAMNMGLIPESVIKEAQKKYGDTARNRFEAYNNKLAQLKNSPITTKLEEINTFFNEVPYAQDITVWGKNDYWATPLEFLGNDKGDCEDYVIAKYFALRSLNVKSEQLFFSYVKSKRFKGAHMVLSYFETPNSIPLILDNTNFKVFSADKRTDLIPIYNFNGEALYLARQQGKQGAEVTKQTKINKKWDRLMNDIKRNKI